ncbi:sensor histidine kinase [Haloarcula marina]|uniref:sensor histidine kinase n=1 Tax=Haloarcula marina TaxID=2961574 RepID=UPI0020B6CDDD|nr:histidine kinase N-terminal 7TM domain-containing protein [Halomicroarcula marina]
MLRPATVSVVVVVLIAVAVVTSFGFAWYARRRTRHPVSGWFSLLMAADGTWALLTLLELLSPTDAFALLLGPFVAFTGVSAAVIWFQFVVEYTGDSTWVPPIVGRLLGAQTAVYALLYVLNPGELVYTTRGVAQYGVVRLPYEVFGPLAYLELAVVYALLSVTFLLLGRLFVQSRNLYRKQTGLIFAGTSAVALANVAFFAGISPHPRLDLTPVLFVAQAAGVGVALFRYDFLDVTPMAADTLLDEMRDPVFVVDGTGRVIDQNAAAAPYLGALDDPTLSDVGIPGLGDVIAPTDGGVRVEPTEVTTLRQHSDRLSTVTYDVRTTPIRDRYDSVQGYVVVLRDVTERKARERALENQNKRLEEFTGVVSHDLRNPLQVIDGHVRMAHETGDLSHLEEATDAIGRMESMLSDLLELAREGQTIDEKAEVDLESCCRAAWDAVETEDATLDVETNLSVLADPERLQQVFENLFGNAVEHGSTNERPAADGAAEHGATNSQPRTDDSDAVTVTVGDFEGGFYVADDGPGIPPAKRDSVFEFGVTHTEDSTGYGLGIVQRIVEAHGWRIAATESESGGARFEVTGLYSS